METPVIGTLEAPGPESERVEPTRLVPVTVTTAVCPARTARGWTDVMAGDAVTEMARASATCWFKLSCTLTVKLEEPTVVGLPSMIPVAGCSVRPKGSEPTTTE